MSFQHHLFGFELGGRDCVAYVYRLNEDYWQASATDNDGGFDGGPIQLRIDRYSTLQEAGVRAVQHYQEGCQIVAKK